MLALVRLPPATLQVGAAAGERLQQRGGKILAGQPLQPSEDEYFMSLALQQARLAFSDGEVPIGAVLVHQGKIISEAHNRVEALSDASAHAEMLCARAAATDPKWPSWRLEATTMYCTVEPCPMCLAALHAFRIERLVYGTTNPRLGAVESAMRPLGEVQQPFHKLNVTGGVLADDAGDLMRDFFRQRRQEGFLGPSALPTDATRRAESMLERPLAVGGVWHRVRRAINNFRARSSSE